MTQGVKPLFFVWQYPNKEKLQYQVDIFQRTQDYNDTVAVISFLRSLVLSLSRYKSQTRDQ